MTSSVLRSLLALVATAATLTACSGTNSSATNALAFPIFGPTSPPGPGPTPASVAITPTTLTFATATSAAQTFTITSSIPNTPAPTLTASGCSPVVNVTGGGGTLPATYTVTPTANGSCTLVVTLGNESAALGIVVGNGTSPTLSATTGTLTFTLGSGPQTFTITASGGSGPGTLTIDPTACAGIVSITGAGGPPPQTFTATPLQVGSCNATVYDGANYLVVPIVVNPATPTAASAVTVSPQALSFTSPSAAPQQISLNFTGSVGAVTIDESSCIANNAKIAYLTLNGTTPGTSISLPATATVTPYGPGFATGSCTIIFTPQTGAPAVLNVTVGKAQ